MPHGVAYSPHTAFVLGGGGLLGAAEVGMLRALLERGIVPDLVVGSSVGAFNGVFLAADPADATVERLVQSWKGISGRGIFEGSLAVQLGTLFRTGTHLHSNEPLRRILEDELGPAKFADLAIPFECVAACIEEAGPRWFSSGPVVPAVLASCAVPGLLPPIEIDGQHFLDGGLVRSVPVGRAVALGSKRIFVLHVGRLERPLEPPTKPWDVALVSFEIARRHPFQEEIANLPEDVEVHVLPTGSSPPNASIRYRSTSGVPERIDAAYGAALAYLDAASD